MPPLISVIVPVYNLEAYIQHTLDSLFAQTYRELEVITVDDGSTDKSSQILDEYAMHESRLRVIHQSNGGVSAARNAGLVAAKGDYIGFCDGDDEVEPEMYERLLANLLKYDADISHCGMLTIGLDGQTRYFHNTGALEVHSHEEGLLEILKGEKVEPSLCMKLYKKELFQDFQFDPSIQINEDLLANVRLFQKANKTVFEDVCLYHYIRRENSASKRIKSEKHLSQLIYVRQKIIDLISYENEYIKQQAEVSLLLICISVYTLSYEIQDTNENKIRQQVRNRVLERRKYIPVLSFSSRVHAWLIINFPKICDSLVPIIRNFKQKKYG